MGKGFHGGFQGTSGSPSASHTFADNLPKLTKKYPASSTGYFGEKGKGKHVRRISSRNPLDTARDFYRKATEGAVYRGPLIRKNKGPVPHSEVAFLRDGSRIQIREISSSDGTPTVEICIDRLGFIKPQKIHFIPKGGHK